MSEIKAEHHQQNLCPICQAVSIRPLFEGYGFDHVAERFQLLFCHHCQLAHLHPLLSSVQLREYYTADYYGHQTQKKFTQPVEMLVRLANTLRVNTLIKFLPSTHSMNNSAMKVLDIGCGRGNFLKVMHQKGFDCYGTEIDSYSLPASEPHLTFKNGLLEDLALPPQSFAAISIWHVLEHTTDPRQVIRQISNLLIPNGIVAIAVPNFGSNQRRLFGKHWFHLDLPRHLYHFSESSLVTLLQENGLHPVKINTHSLDQNIFGFIQSAINCLMPTRANLLYSLLKRKLDLSGNKYSNVFYAALSILLVIIIFPLSLIENAVSVFQGNGATLIVYARREQNNRGQISP